MIQEINSDWWSGLFKDDPVRPHIPANKRMSGNKKAWVLTHENGIDAQAVICAAFCSDVPVTEQDLDKTGDSVVAFYTVWSYGRGAGKKIIFEVADFLKANYPKLERYVTLSPKTDMAYKFHIRNGAELISENQTTDNYEYKNI